MSFRRYCVASVLAFLFAGHAQAVAPIISYGDFGVWSVGRTTSLDGIPSCFMQTTWTDGRILTIHAFSSDLSYIQFDLFKPTWDIPVGTSVPVVMTLGSYPSSTMNGSGRDKTVSFGLGAKYIGQLRDEMIHTDAGSFSFPGGTEQSWLLQPDGAAQAMPAFGRCVSAMPTPPPATQPFGASSSGAKGPAL